MISKRYPLSRGVIGVFDSGVGGLSVLKELRKLLPRERYVFVADQANVPYGAKTDRQLKELSRRICSFLMANDAKLIVVACNTATCYAISHLRRLFPVPFVGTVPAVKPALEHSHTGIVAVVSTPATAKSPMLKRLVSRFSNGQRVVAIGCPGLEESVECGGLTTRRTAALLDRYLAGVRASGADYLVLGCTHYPFLTEQIKERMDIPILDSGAAIARRTRFLLKQHGIPSRAKRGGVVYYTTGDSHAFSRVASALLSTKVRARHIAF